MKKQILLLSVYSTIILNLISCKKDEVTPTPTPTPAPAASTPNNPTPTPNDANGVLAAVKTITFVSVPTIGNVEQDIGVAAAAFWNVANTYLDGGTVSVNSNALTKASNNGYAFAPSATSTTGIDFSSSINWSIGGNSTNGVPTFTHSPLKSFPTMGAMTAITKVTRANGVTVSSSGAISNADSVIFSVYGPSGNAQVFKDGNSHTFTAAELSAIGAGNGFVQIAAYTIESYTTGGKKYYFVNESVATNSVTID